MRNKKKTELVASENQKRILKNILRICTTCESRMHSDQYLCCQDKVPQTQEKHNYQHYHELFFLFVFEICFVCVCLVLDSQMMEADVRCIVCFELWQDASTRITACGNLLCVACQKLLVDCPACRCPLNQYHILHGHVEDLAKQFYRNALIRCENAQCTMEVQTFALQSHKDNNCIWTTVACDDCKIAVARCQMDAHRLEYCSHRLIKCDSCGQEMIANLLEQHCRDICALTKLTCTSNGCKICIERCNLLNHITNDCQFAQIKCTQGECSDMFLRYDIAKHHKECQYTKIVCQHCSLSITSMERKKHLNVCTEKYIQCQGCKKNVAVKYLFSHLTMHCTQRSTLCTQKYGCCFVISPNKTKEHECPLKEFGDQKVMLGLQLDIWDAYSKIYQCYVVKASESAESTQFNALLMVDNDNFLPEHIQLDRAFVRIAPFKTFTQECYFHPGNTVVLPLNSFNKCLWTCGQSMHIDSHAVSLGVTSHNKAKYITLSTNPRSNSTLTYHHFEISETKKQPLALVSCQIVQVFPKHLRIVFKEKHYCYVRNCTEEKKVRFSTDLVGGRIYECAYELICLKYINYEIDEECEMLLCFQKIHFPLELREYDARRDLKIYMDDRCVNKLKIFNLHG